jgi:UDP-N-acetylglucosamine 2-epimerase
VPCVTLRNNTERPETVEVGANVLAGTEPDVILNCAREMLERENSWLNPFGDGRAGDRIVCRCLEYSLFVGSRLSARTPRDRVCKLPI